eukprot:4828453-Pyramimonas_sp.AAC.1
MDRSWPGPPWAQAHHCRDRSRSVSKPADAGGGRPAYAHNCRPSQAALGANPAPVAAVDVEHGLVINDGTDYEYIAPVL